MDQGLFKVKVEINDGKGGTIQSVAEPGSLRELAGRGADQDISHKSGYRAGQCDVIPEVTRSPPVYCRLHGGSGHRHAPPHRRRYSCSASLCFEMVIIL